MKQILLLFTVLVSSVLHAQTTGYKINIDVKGLPEKCEVFLKDFETTTEINKGVLVGGKGTLQGQMENAPRLLFLTLYTGSETYWCNFMIDAEEVTIQAATKDFPFHVKVQGSAVQDVFSKLNTELADNRTLRDSLFAYAKTIMTNADKKAELKRLVREMAVIDSMEIVTKKEFVESNLQSYPAVLELFLVRSSYEKAEVAALFLQLSETLKQSAYGVKLKNYLGIEKIVAKGDKAFAFSAQDKDGNIHPFPEANGKYVLLDFTKDYCAPCVASVKELKEISTKYKDRLAVVSFSPDEKQGWLKGLQRDQPSWLNLWDGKGTAGPVILNYGVQAYPTFLLIDPSGTVVAKSVGYSAGSLQTMLKSFL
ncbi:redoxin domain-containing protein [Sediminibacterium roseum]|uniref:Redoxin domain-containing protein n=1 Tax=Sediminibacterium roseum TaxID=1978412 RepID=A0ABW9ZW25_9BACT|nr:thioredoxin-like domain-containing protein [Sediminibacterium roseum]NCI51346.1 redoxin domain-containing protein [Sediminibacterium roseum]